MPKYYIIVSGVLFGIVALAHALRALMQVPVLIGSFEVPVFTSWLVAAGTGALCAWAFRSKS